MGEAAIGADGWLLDAVHDGVQQQPLLPFITTVICCNFDQLIKPRIGSAINEFVV